MDTVLSKPKNRNSCCLSDIVVLWGLRIGILYEFVYANLNGNYHFLEKKEKEMRPKEAG